MEDRTIEIQEALAENGEGDFILHEDELDRYCLFTQRCRVAARHLGGKAKIRKEKRGGDNVHVTLEKEQ